MTCRAAILPTRPFMPTARERFELINVLAVALYDAAEREESSAELRELAVDIQNLAVVGAAYERRRERGETLQPVENVNAR